MKKIFSSIFLLLAVLTFGQVEYDYYQGNMIKYKRSQNIGYINGFENKAYFVRDVDKDNVRMYEFSDSMNFSTSYRLGDWKKEVSTGKGVKLLLKSKNDHLYIIKSTRDYMNNVYKVYAQTLDKDYNYGAEKILIDFQNVNLHFNDKENYKSSTGEMHFMNELNAKPRTDLIVSPSGNFVASVVEFLPLGSGNVTCSIMLFNEELALLKETKVSIPISQSRLLLDQIALNDNGTLFFTAIKFNDSRNLVYDTKQNYETLIYAIDQKGTIKNKTIPLSSYIQQNIQIELGQNEELICTTLLAHKKLSNVVGAAYFKYDFKSNDVTVQKENVFSKELILKYSKGNKRELWDLDYTTNGFGIIKNLNLVDVFWTEKGTYMIAEEFQMDKAGIATNDVWHDPIDNKNQYSFGVIVVAFFDHSGKLLWSDKINKEQVMMNEFVEFGSLAPFEINGNMYVMFNDHSVNLKNQESVKKYYGTSTKTAVLIHQFTPEGVHSEEMAHQLHHKEGVFIPKSILKIDKSIYFLASKFYSNSFVRMDFR